MTDAQGFVSVESTASDSASRVSPSTPLAPAASGSGSTQGISGQVVQLFQRSSHPTAAVFHVLFKGSALLFYLLSGWFTQSFVIIFVVVIILMAFDFWTVKNVTGRLMVGLRWWNDVAEDGTATWRYESIEDPSQVSRPDYVIFWYSLYLSALLWSLFGFLAIFSHLEYILLCGVSFVLVWSNIYGFWNCSSERARVEQSVQSAFTQGTMAALTGKFNFAGLTGARAPDNV